MYPELNLEELEAIIGGAERVPDGGDPVNGEPVIVDDGNFKPVGGALGLVPDPLPGTNSGGGRF